MAEIEGFGRAKTAAIPLKWQKAVEKKQKMQDLIAKLAECS